MFKRGESSSGVVTNASPVNGGGNYLSTSVPAGEREVAMYRGITDYGGVNLAREHTVSFDFRVDDATRFDAAGSQTWFQFENTDGTSSSSTTHTWWAGINANAGGDPGVWAFRDGSGVGKGHSSAATDFGVVAGVTYSFEFHVLPEQSQYSALLTDSTGNEFQSGLLNFRGEEGAGLLTRAGDNLIFDTKSSSETNITELPLEYSIDNISIVPEPASAGMGLALAGFLTALITRRSRKS